MLIEKEIKIKIGSANYKHFYEKYGPFKKNDIINVKIEDLMINSVVKVTAICEKCGNHNTIKYQTYNIQIKNGGFFCCNKCKSIKMRETNQKKYGVSYPMQREDVKNKSKKTLLNKYNIENISQRKDIRKKRSNRLKNDEYKEKMLNGVILKYGVNNVSKIDDIKKKKKETCLNNWGVESPLQSNILFEKSQKNGKKIYLHKNTNLWYRGTYELDFLNFCFDNNIKVQKGPTICYFLNGHKKYYHSDFYIPECNLICEIKSSYYYEKYLEINLAKKEFTMKAGYDFIFIINKDYVQFKLTKFSV